MRIDGREVAFPDPSAAKRAGIVCIFQELSLMPDLSVADNICIADPPRRLGLIDRRAQRRRAEQLLARVGCEDVHPLALVKDLPLSRRQMVEIAKALGREPRLLILDEATSALTSADVEKVYAILRQLRDEGLALLYISHRMHEIEALADTCSVFRNGRHVETFAKGARSEDEIVQLMIGREWAHVYPPKPDARRPAPRPCSRSTGCAGTTASRTCRSRSARARSWAWAASTARASGSCCWRCSACCGASAARSGSTAGRCRSAAPPRPRAGASAWR